MIYQDIYIYNDIYKQCVYIYYIYIYHISVVHGGYEATCNCTETTLGWKSPSFCPPSNHGFCGLRSSHRHCILGIMISVAWNFKPETNCGWLHSWIVRVKSWIIYPDWIIFWDDNPLSGLKWWFEMYICQLQIWKNHRKTTDLGWFQKVSKS